MDCYSMDCWHVPGGFLSYTTRGVEYVYLNHLQFFRSSVLPAIYPNNVTANISDTVSVDDSAFRLDLFLVAV